jgi:hypothetical protein
MGGKKKKGKKKKGKKEEPEPEDEFMKMDGATLEKTMAALKEKLTDAKIKRNLIQIEKDMIHDFYHSMRGANLGMEFNIHWRTFERRS